MRNPAIILTCFKSTRRQCGLLWLLLALTLSFVATCAQASDPNQTVDVTTDATWTPDPALVQQVITSGASGSDNSIPKPQNEDTVTPHWTWTTVQVYASPTGAPGSFTPYTGNSVVEWPNTDDTQPDTNFTGQFWDPNYYIVEVIALVRYHDDTAGTDVATHYGYGYLGGTASDIAGSSGTGATSMPSFPQQKSEVIPLDTPPTPAPTGPVQGMPVVPATLEVDVNDTSATNDDVVRLASQTPQRTFWVPCQIKLNNSQQGQQDIMATVTDQTGAVAFSMTDPSTGKGYVDGPATSVTSLNLTVPGDGSPVTFWITGVSGSSKVGDDSIQASSTSPGRIEAVAQPVTVFWFENPLKQGQVGGKMTNAVAHNYETSVDGTTVRLKPFGGILGRDNAITFSASTILQPTKLDTTVPQLKDLRIGTEQNIGPTTWTTTYGKLTQDSVEWIPDVVAQDAQAQNGVVQITCAATLIDTQSAFTSRTNDTVDQAGFSDNVPFYCRAYLQPLNSVYNDTDGPYYTAGDASLPNVIVKKYDSQNRVLAIVHYEIIQMHEVAAFYDYCTIGDNKNAIKGQTQWLAEGKWSLNVTAPVDLDQTGQGGPASAGTQNVVPPSDLPVNEDPPPANTVGASPPHNLSDGSGVITFSWPPPPNP